MREIVQQLCQLDWTDLTAVSEESQKVLSQLVEDSGVLNEALRAVADQPELASMCEHYDILDKVVLYNDPVSGVRVRLHIFLPGYFDRPHNHRWTYTSLILKGGYKHTLYGTDEDLDDTLDPRELEPVMVRREEQGTTYTLHHSMIHAITADPHTMSLVVRGPAVKDRFIVSDRVTGRSWWQYGHQKEDPKEAIAKRMTPERLQFVIDQFATSGVL